MDETKNHAGFYYIEVKPKEKYKAFRTHHVEEMQGIDRVAGQRENGGWDTVKWLISKEMAHIENDELVADHPNAKQVFKQLASKPILIEGDQFKARTLAEKVE